MAFWRLLASVNFGPVKVHILSAVGNGQGKRQHVNVRAMRLRLLIWKQSINFP
jgi:hypothetical protein